MAEIKISDKEDGCQLVHCCCGSCGCAIFEDGTCNCKDNRVHPIGKAQTDKASLYLIEIARLRKVETTDIPSIEEGEQAIKDRAKLIDCIYHMNCMCSINGVLENKCDRCYILEWYKENAN